MANKKYTSMSDPELVGKITQKIRNYKVTISFESGIMLIKTSSPAAMPHIRSLVKEVYRPLEVSEGKNLLMVKIYGT